MRKVCFNILITLSSNIVSGAFILNFKTALFAILAGKVELEHLLLGIRFESKEFNVQLVKTL